MTDEPIYEDVARKLAERQDLMVAAARNLLAHRDAGRKCDPAGLRWAEFVIEQAEKRKDAGFEPRRVA